MIVQNQLVEIKWHGSNRKTLESHGYIYTKLGDVIKIPVCHLSEKSHVKVKIICDWCNNEKLKRRTDIALDGNHFCNTSCYGKWLKESEDAKSIHQKRVNRILTHCKCCNKNIQKKPSEFTGHGEHYCSRSCMAKHRNATNDLNPKKEKIEVKCDLCGKSYKVHESVSLKNKWHFCSRECYSSYRSENLVGDKIYNYQGIIKECDTCGSETKVTEYYLENRKNIFCSKECYYDFRAKHYIGEKHPQFGSKKTLEQREQMSIVTSSRIANGEFPQTNTSIQIKIRRLIEKLNVPFKEEIQFKYYVLDFYSENSNLAIEVMGDYWHGSPLKYDNYDSLHDIQKKDIKRDKSKKTYLDKYHNIKVLYLWEYDINNNIDICEELILNYVEANGKLKDYNSFNYKLENETLKINDNIILPYFMRANTKHQTI
ncbi:hypothetical protein [Bacillus sp. FJAT-22090]|uniref:hypothetical protein n=1 Tax=Bacillus sp. FJAT-22090 TaxID=1581038 RepID=UPI0011A0988A|nr:hypothetical protein [Bacillus sp. FJAT-22090]